MDLEFAELTEEKETLLTFRKDVFSVKLKCQFVINYGAEVFI